MSHEYTVTLTDAQNKALAHVAYDPQDWIQNAVSERARLAMEEIFKKEVERMIADPSITEIPADRETVVLAADVKSAKEAHDEAMAALVSEDAPVSE
jgi:hypothetical protein